MLRKRTIVSLFAACLLVALTFGSGVALAADNTLTVTTKNNAEEPDIPESSDNDFESDSDDEQTGEENPDVPA